MTNKDLSRYEQSILCSIMHNPNHLRETELNENLFTIPQYKEMYKIFKGSYAQTEQIITPYSETQLAEKGLANDYVLLMDASFTDASYTNDLHYLIDYHNKMKAIHLLDDAIANDEPFEDAKSLINQITSPVIDSCWQFTDDEIINMITNQKSVIEFNKMRFLQEKISMRQRTVITIGARTGVGKSAFGNNLIMDLMHNYKCLYINMEMNQNEVYERFIAINKDLPIKKIRKSKENADVLNDVSDAVFSINKDENLKIYGGSQYLSSIEKIISSNCKKEHCLVFVDYIGLIRDTAQKDEYSRLTHIMQEFVRFTKDYDCTIFSLAQINRSGADEPSLAYLKGSGEIEQSSDTVLLLHDITNDQTIDHPYYKLIVAKNRGNRRGVIFLQYYAEKTKFRFVDNDEVLTLGLLD